ncbi:MAG TPA: antitoxin, partial [Microbacterium sp.]|nr:antitoxin [Microbacterium sp.]
MRTTITLIPEADALVRRVMRERGLSFKDAVNAAIIGGLARGSSTPFETPVRHLGRARIPLDKALTAAAELEEEALLH